MTVVKIKKQRHKKCVIKRKFEDYENGLDEAKYENKTNLLKKRS